MKRSFFAVLVVAMFISFSVAVVSAAEKVSASQLLKATGALKKDVVVREAKSISTKNVGSGEELEINADIFTYPNVETGKEKVGYWIQANFPIVDTQMHVIRGKKRSKTIGHVRGGNSYGFAKDTEVVMDPIGEQIIFGTCTIPNKFGAVSEEDASISRILEIDVFYGRKPGDYFQILAVVDTPDYEFEQMGQECGVFEEGIPQEFVSVDIKVIPMYGSPMANHTQVDYRLGDGWLAGGSTFVWQKWDNDGNSSFGFRVSIMEENLKTIIDEYGNEPVVKLTIDGKEYETTIWLYDCEE